MFTDRTLLITGGTGSFGNAVIRRFLTSDIGEIRVFSRDEKKQDDARRRYNSSRLKFYIGDVRDSASVINAMRGVDFVFNAAALKQVPSCEFFPMEAVKTNVIGTDNVIAWNQHDGLWDALRKRDGFTRFGDTAFCASDTYRSAKFTHGSRNDAVHDDP